MKKNVFCIYADTPNGLCNNVSVKKSFFGIGPRYCIKYWNNNAYCKYYKRPKRPKIKPPKQGTGVVHQPQTIILKVT